MRYVVGILLLVSPAFSAEPVYSWRSCANVSEWDYLYLDGKPIGGWDHRARQYRPFDGTNWGPPTDTAPVRLPEQRVVVFLQQKPMVIPQPSSTLPPLRGPLRVRLGTVAGQIVTDMTMKMIDEIPEAIVDSLKRGDYQLEVKFSVTRSPQQAEGQITSPSPAQPGQSPQRRWAIRRR